MIKAAKTSAILYADDDVEDCMMVQEAWKESRLANPMQFVNDGEELLDFLYHRGSFSDVSTSPRPGLILLDLNLPKVDGPEALQQIKADPNLRRIPVVALTASQVEEDIVCSYDLGVSGFVTKPVTFDRLVEVIRGLATYWFEIVELPRQ